ncbi:MAG: glycosyltransferase family 2 protein [Clostridiales bacterium]|nr:glycosyltransferase family 2 protein [Candidatus Coliplasma equi]
MEKQKISVIVPCYNESEALPFFFEEIGKVIDSMPEYDFECIYVDDGSKDNTCELIRERSKTDENSRFISFSRNFGKESAMLAGLRASVGDFVCIMDADLQDPPSLLPEMMKTLKEKKCDSVGTRRGSRKGEPKVRSFFANCFYGIINKISKVKFVPAARDYRLMSRRMVDAVLSLCEYNRFSKGIFEWVGFKTEWITFQNVKRVAGKTKWSFWGLLKYSFDCIVAFSTAPLSISSCCGFFMFLLSIIGAVIIVIRKLVDATSSADGWASIICVLLFVGGIQLLCIGILGQYLSKTYMETKKRPDYIIAETDKSSEDNK